MSLQGIYHGAVLPFSCYGNDHPLVSEGPGTVPTGIGLYDLNDVLIRQRPPMRTIAVCRLSMTWILRVSAAMYDLGGGFECSYLTLDE